MPATRTRSPESIETHDRVADLVRGGLTVVEASTELAAELGITRGAVAQRYYVVERTTPTVATSAKPAREPRPPRRRATDAPPDTIPEVDVVSLLETAAAMIAEAAKAVRVLEHDAARYRRVRGALDDL